MILQRFLDALAQGSSDPGQLAVGDMQAVAFAIAGAFLVCVFLMCLSKGRI